MRRTAPKAGVKRMVALMNGRAGAFSQRHAANIEKTLKASFSRLGLGVEIEFIRGEGLNEAVHKARGQAERGEIDAVIIGGGDGSVLYVACGRAPGITTRPAAAEAPAGGATPSIVRARGARRPGTTAGVTAGSSST